MNPRMDKTTLSGRGIPRGSLAVALICFYLAASARTLIPGLCATVEVADGRENPTVSKAAHACCLRVPVAAGPRKALSKAIKSIPTCALCNLAQCPAQTAAYAYLVPAREALDGALPHFDADPQIQDSWSPVSRRGPPPPESHSC